jgi:hypothetical protein
MDSQSGTPAHHQVSSSEWLQEIENLECCYNARVQGSSSLVTKNQAVQFSLRPAAHVAARDPNNACMASHPAKDMATWWVPPPSIMTEDSNDYPASVLGRDGLLLVTAYWPLQQPLKTLCYVVLVTSVFYDHMGNCALILLGLLLLLALVVRQTTLEDIIPITSVLTTIVFPYIAGSHALRCHPILWHSIHLRDPLFVLNQNQNATSVCSTPFLMTVGFQISPMTTTSCFKELTAALSYGSYNTLDRTETLPSTHSTIRLSSMRMMPRCIKIWTFPIFQLHFRRISTVSSMNTGRYLTKRECLFWLKIMNA